MKEVTQTPIIEAATMNDSDPQVQSFKYQLDFLKLEFDSINEIIKRIDEITQTTKNWAILIWAGSISVAIGKTELRPYVILTAILPLLFWYVDARWRRVQRQFIFRLRKISEFLNSPQLVESFKQCKLVGFQVLDPRGHQHAGTPEYQAFINFYKTMRFSTVGGIYLWLMVVSLVLGVLSIFVIKNA